MDAIHGCSFGAHSTERMTSRPPPEDHSRRSQKEQPHKTLMDRVLVTPIKSGRPSFVRSGRPHPKPATPSRTLRHYSRRISSGHAFAPYPKRGCVENAPPPRTPSYKIRRTLSDHSCFSTTVAKALASPSKRAHLTSRRHLTSPPKRSSKRARRPSRSGPPLTKTQSDSSLNASWWSNIDSMRPSPSTRYAEQYILDDPPVGRKTRSVQDVDLELEFQTLHLKDDHEPATNPNLSDFPWPAINDSAQSKHHSISLNSAVSAATPDSWGGSVHTFVARLRNALAEERQTRERAEYQYQQELQRRVELEELVTQLQRERDEYSRQLSLVQPPPASSSPLLLPSSPCTSSRMSVNAALLGP